jgi:hypothetical protein
MTYAFLFLTYENPYIDYDKIPTNNIYIHPKYPSKINNKYKPCIIKNLIDQTSWCDFSIVSATLNLLKEALLDNSNEWFFLLSEDTYLLYDKDEFIIRFEKLHQNRSIFNFKSRYKKYYKTSQWWVLKKEDVETIIANESKYLNRFKYKIQNGCPDEYYFLSILMWDNPNYKYTNIQIMYDKWLNHTIQRSPAYFNHVLIDDIEYINKNNCLYMRKITKEFSLDRYNTRRKLYIIYIGSETNQQDIIFNDEFDIMLIISIDINSIRKELISRSIYIFNIIYKFLYETILNICIEKFILNWNLIIFTTEKFNMNNYNSIDKTKQSLPYDRFNFKNIPLSNLKEFYFITDNRDQLAFCIRNKYD